MLRALVIGLFTFAVVACGGGGGGGDSSSTPAAPATGTGGSVGNGGTANLKIVLGDGPIDRYDGFLLYIERITLLGADGQENVVLRDTPSVVDLLQLRNITELLVDEDVVAGTYSKIRLNVSKIEAINRGEDGAVIESVDVDVPANGKVDLNPQGEFDIEAGEDLVVEVDVDLDRSVKVKENGNGQLKFRPVVFIRILDGSERIRLTRLFGQIDNISADGFDLCQLEALADEMDLPDDECVSVVMGDSALVVDEAGQEIPLENLVNGDFATVFGRFRFDVESEVVVAEVVASGDEDAFEHISGRVVADQVDGVFDLTEADEEADEEGGAADDLADQRTVELVGGARILNREGETLDVDAIVEGAEAEVFGVDVDDGNFVGIVAWIAHEEASDVVNGVLTAINLGDSTLTLDLDGVEQCVAFNDDTVFLMVTEDDDTAEVAELSIDELANGLNAEAFGEIEGDCLTADEIVFEPVQE